MADDKDGGGGLGTWMGGVIGAAQGAVADIVTELESFTKFQQRVDQLIKDLKGSPADAKKVGEEVLDRHKFGGGEGGFHEASGLHTSYATVIGELENLSKLLSDSIEGMGIAVLASHKGYANIDDDVRRRMHAISVETTKHYGGEYEPPTHKKSEQAPGKDGADAPTSGESGGDSGGAI
ncbi:hypothetical protein GTW43_09960 [Streptomyces sp. SID5785]|uniref:hypothetical protein n=1 Tax=Streptomyces sp. SID5785 TaxID=2690309 RepID=UPI0013610C66|nr:hypothetical protein [Streptomyces sp. SID5785]MZD05403.1 hypothetical protein [Streptomyces sp. SID5785]